MGIHSMRLELLGPFCLSTGGRALQVPGQQLRALVTVLALETDGIPRDRLVTLLWPGVQRRSALHSLSQGLYRLVRIMGSGHLVATRESVQLINIEVDYYRLKDAVGDRSPVAARMIKGPLAEGLAWKSAAWEAWLNCYRSDYLSLLKTLSERLARGSDWEALREVAQVYSRAGGGEEAYALLRLAETQVVTRRANPASEKPPFEEPEASGLFVGRVFELERLETYWEEVGVSTGGAVVVTGPPGIGKTSLCYRFLRHVAVSGSRTLICRGFPTEQNLPFGVVGQLLRDNTLEQPLNSIAEPWRGILATTFPLAHRGGKFSAVASGSEAGQLAIYEALRQLIALVGRVVVLVDDADSCDPVSLGFLHYLNRLNTASGAMVLLAAREPGIASLTSSFRNSRLLRLKELSQSEVSELVQRLAARSGKRAPDPSFVFARSGGNPLFVQAVTAHPADPDSDASDVFGDILRPRLSRLSAHAQAVLAALSVAGERAEISVLADICGLEGDPLFDALAELESERLVDKRDNVMAATHGLAGEVLLRDLPVVTRRLMHARAAKSLRNGSAPSAVLAVNYDIAGEPLDAFEHAMNAARASLRLYAYKEAEYFLKLARSYAPSAPEAMAITVELARVYHRTGRFAEAAAIPDPAIGDDSDDTRALRAYRLVAQIEISETPDRLLPAGQAMVDLLLRGRNHQLACLLLAHMGRVAHDMGRISETILFAKQLLSAAQDLTDPEEAQQFRVKAAGLLGLSQSMAAALDALRESDFPANNLPVRISSLLTRGSILLASGKLPLAERDFLETATLVEHYGLYGHLFHLYNNFGVCYLEWGRYSEAESLLRKAFDIASTSSGDALVAGDNLAILFYETGRFGEALQLALQSLEANASLRSPRSWFAAMAMAGLSYLQLGKLAEAGQCEREVRLALEKYEYWLADISYVEVFLARMISYRGHAAKAIARLADAAKRYEDRDFFCGSRIRVELIRLMRSRNPEAPIHDVCSFRARLVDACAYPLVEQLERYCAELRSC